MCRAELDAVDHDIIPPGKTVKLKSPWVAVGGAATVGALCSMIYASKKGHSNLLQTSMRARVALQGITVAIMAGTSGIVFGDQLGSVFGMAPAKKSADPTA